MITFLNENSGAIQAILVLTLVLVTVWYAVSTKKMANIMFSQFLTSTRPYLSPSRVIDRYFEPGVDPSFSTCLQLRLGFTNVGNVSVNYYVNELILNGTSINPEKIETILFPSQEGYLKSALLKSQKTIGNGDGFKGNVEVIFWASGFPEVKYYFRRSFTLAPEITMIIDKEEFGKVD